jgi:hypothetical protein
MHRLFPVCAALAALSLVASQPVRAADVDDVKGTYAFTLAEKCVHQRTFKLPPGNNGFNSNFQITDPMGAMTYGGASDGLMVFDGKGGVSFQAAEATNVMNSVPDFLQTGDVPLGFGFGPAIPFTCTGSYSVVGGKKIDTITLAVTCSATVPPNPSVLGFSSTFNMKGPLPQNPSHFVLTDIGNSVQLVTIFLKPSGTVTQHRVCTRSTTLDRVSR